jgi:hypothetical protein
MTIDGRFKAVNRRPWWLLMLTLAGIVACVGLALSAPARAGQSGQIALGVADLMLGLAGALLLAFVGWRVLRRSDGRGELVKVWAVVIGAAVLRLMLFAQADYDRGRLPFFMVLAVALAAAFLLVKRRILHRKDASS